MFTFSYVPDTALGAGPSDRCLSDFSSYWGGGRCRDHLTAAEREAVSGDTAGNLVFPSLPLGLDPGFSAGLLSHRAISEAPLLPLLGISAAWDLPGAFLHL